MPEFSTIVYLVKSATSIIQCHNFMPSILSHMPSILSQNSHQYEAHNSSWYITIGVQVSSLRRAKLISCGVQDPYVFKIVFNVFISL